MTRKQKREVDHLRIIGVSASDIASQLGLSVNTVRSYYFRHALDDLIQECEIVVWEIISRGNFKGGNFNAYFAAAIRNRLIQIWRDFNRKNLISLGEVIDEHWGVTRIMVESDYAREYREKQRQRSKAWYEKKKVAKPKKPPMTKEEKIARQVAWQREYYATHPDKLAKRREKNRIRERERRAARKAERLAAIAMV